jgi:hypothetical protein
MARNTLRHSLWTELETHGDELISVWAQTEPVLGRWDTLGRLVDDLDAFPEVDVLSALARLSQTDHRAGLVVIVLFAGPRAWRIVGKTNARFRYSAVTEDEVVCEAWELLHRLNPKVWVMETFMWEVSRRIATRLSREGSLNEHVHSGASSKLDWLPTLTERQAETSRNASEELLEVFVGVRDQLSPSDSELISAWLRGTIDEIAVRDQVSKATLQRRKDRAMQRLVDAARMNDALVS